ncbi:MAG: hypothetical protein NT031_16795 [Planctomycetota bacterium]|nr:hypothetical protein [Planctomycetota bacterium]
MATTARMSVCLWAMLGVLALSAPARGHVSIGKGNDGLLGNDLTDPRDTIAAVDKVKGTDAQLKPINAGWVKMIAAPVGGPHSPYHPNPYQSSTGSPAVAIFMNKPDQMKWRVNFKDGGYGGPTREDPYFAAVQFKEAYLLSHFTITTGDAPGHDPKEWALQASNTGEDDDWTDLYVCNAKDRTGTAFQEGSRNETFLFTSFTSAELVKIVSMGEARNLMIHLKGKPIAKADFPRPRKAYTWFRLVVYSCFNPTAANYIYNNTSNGFALGQWELFGVSGPRESVTPKPPKPEVPAKAPVMDAPFLITYWCGPPKAQTTLGRYKELAECGFNVAFPAIDNLWEPASKDQDEHNRKYLDLCQEAGLKAFIWDGHIPRGDGTPPKPADLPQMDKAMDDMIAKYSAHPAFLGFVLGDEMPGSHARIGALNQYLLKKDPKHLPYYNNLPSYAFGNPKSYERSVVDYLTVVKPALFSWDHYRQMFQGGDEQYYWENLEIVRRNCLKAKVPYIQIIVSIMHMGYRECSEADLRWQVWTSLAYGSRGITYFTYCHVPGMAWGDAPALLSKDFKRDAKWGYAQKINRRIAQLGPTLVKLSSTGVYLTGRLPNGTRPLLPEAPVKKADGGDLAIGCFQEAAGDNVYIMPVNRSLGGAITASLKLQDRFASASEISQETGKPLPPVIVTGKTLDVPLEAGEGKLFLLTKKK